MRVLYALLTIGLLAVTWIVPFYGFALSLRPSADTAQRLWGVLFLAPGLALLLLLIGLLPPVRGRLLLGIGLTADLLALPFLVLYVAHSHGAEGVFVAFLALIYFGTWWLLAAPKLHSSDAASDWTSDA